MQRLGRPHPSQWPKKQYQYETPLPMTMIRAASLSPECQWGSKHPEALIQAHSQPDVPSSPQYSQQPEEMSNGMPEQPQLQRPSCARALLLPGMAGPVCVQSGRTEAWQERRRPTSQRPELDEVGRAEGDNDARKVIKKARR